MSDKDKPKDPNEHKPIDTGRPLDPQPLDGDPIPPPPTPGQTPGPPADPPPDNGGGN